MNKRTKVVAIDPKVKKVVHERDRGRCLFCGKPVTVDFACAHVIPRSAGGLGVEENIITACFQCHINMDSTPARQAMLVTAKTWLKKTYPHWDEKKYVYKKGETDEN